MNLTFPKIKFHFLVSRSLLAKSEYVFSVMAYGLKDLADLFAVWGHALKKCLFFRFAEGVRPYKPPYAGCGQFVKAADPEKQTLLRLDPFLPTSN